MAAPRRAITTHSSQKSTEQISNIKKIVEQYIQPKVNVTIDKKNEVTYLWAFKEKLMLDELSSKAHIHGLNVVFFDDTPEYGYNGIVVRDPDDTISITKSFLD